MLSDGRNQYLYDGEGRVCAVLSQPLIPSGNALYQHGALPHVPEAKKFQGLKARPILLLLSHPVFALS